MNKTIEERVDEYLNEKEDIGFKDLPKGWTKKSLQKFARSLTGKSKNDTEGFFTKCYEKIKDEEGFDEDSAKRFCAALKDEYLERTDWREGRGEE